MHARIRILVIVATTALLVSACGGDTDTSTTDASAVVEAETAGVRVVSPTEGAAIQADPPSDLVILDVRTLEEFGEGHLDGAAMIDFYLDDFPERLAELDRDVPYLLYCRSGNRSGQTRQMMIELGFTNVADVEGGIVAWSEAGLPLAEG